MEEDKELKAMKEIYKSLADLDEEAQIRVLDWVSGRLDIQKVAIKQPSAAVIPATAVSSNEAEFKTFADLFNVAQPATNSDKALVAGYWLQVCQGYEEFPSQSVNKELQNLGHAIANITDAFNGLKSKKPALAIQVKKSGKSQQARKQYKLTQAGIDEVKNMIQQHGH